MLKIEMSNKFFHSPAWDKDQEIKLRTLNKILQNKEITVNNDNNVYLSTFPNGFYSSLFSGQNSSSYDGFDMTRSSFYFILDSNIMKDLDTIPGCYANEIIVKDSINLNDYFLGIGNAGYKINNNLVICYYYMKFLNKELTELDLYKKLYKILFPMFKNKKDFEIYIDEWANLTYEDGKTEYGKCISTFLKAKPNELINYGYYDRIKDIFKDNNMLVNIYDNAGYIIEPEQQLIRVRKMQDYIKGNS